jgi:hypothetical protein
VVTPVPAPGATSAPTSVDDAREAFLVELESFQLMLRKSVMICEAEARQVEEYQREKERISAYISTYSHSARLTIRTQTMSMGRCVGK